ncbi:MAG: Hsp20/alpha crystallin family protein [Pseudomonadota bacterium]
MNIVRWNPLREFDDLFARSAHWGHREAAANRWVPRADILESSDGYRIELELPAVAAADVDVSVREGVLSIEGERRASYDGDAADSGKVHRVERLYGRFARSFRLPEDADPEAVEAKAKYGVLTLSIPRREAATRRAIEVQTS